MLTYNKVIFCLFQDFITIVLHLTLLDLETKWYIRVLEFMGEEAHVMSSNEESTKLVDNLHDV